MTVQGASADDHPWYLELRPDPAGDGCEAAAAAWTALDALGAIVLQVHADTPPSMTELAAGRCRLGWTILVPGSVGLETIEAIAATLDAGYRADIAPGHPLPPMSGETGQTSTNRRAVPHAPTMRASLTPVVEPSLAATRNDPGAASYDAGLR